MPPQNPITRIELVARALGELGEQLESYVGADARRALTYWARELLQAVDALKTAR